MPSTTSKLSIVEPHPSVITSRSGFHTGRGGAGNKGLMTCDESRECPTSEYIRRLTSTSTTTSSSSSSQKKTPSAFSFGRGGAGNMHDEPPRLFSFDEELERQMIQEQRMAPVYHVGRGGAGNVFASSKPEVRRVVTSGSFSSTSSAESGADIATRGLKKGWKKMTKVL